MMFQKFRQKWLVKKSRSLSEEKKESFEINMTNKLASIQFETISLWGIIGHA